MDLVQHGRAIINIAKALRAYSSDMPMIVRHFPATRTAGNAGLFASNIRGYDTRDSALSSRRSQAMYNEAGLDVFTYEQYIKPWLVRENLAFFEQDTCSRRCTSNRVCAGLAGFAGLAPKFGFEPELQSLHKNYKRLLCPVSTL